MAIARPVKSKRKKAQANNNIPASVVLGLDEVLAGCGQALQVSGNQPFLVDDPQNIWLVQTGTLEIFLVREKGGAMLDTRYHVCSVMPGQIVFGLEAQDTPLKLLAVGSPETQVLKLTRIEIEQKLEDRAVLELVSPQLDQWLLKLTENLTADSLTVPTQVVLKPGEVVEVARQQRVGLAGSGSGWVTLPPQAVLFMGEEELSQESEISFPLYGNSWLQALSACSLVGLTTSEVLLSGKVWQGLEEFSRVYFLNKQTSLGLAAYDEINRLRKRVENENNLRQAAVSQLAQVLDGAEAEVKPGLERKPDPLFETCVLVGQAQGLFIQNLTATQEERLTNTDQRLAEILRVSRVRTRRVRLDSAVRWWDKEHGPLLGFLLPQGQNGKKPVALLPIAGKVGYELVEAISGTRIKVNQEVAARLENETFQLYRSFPEEILNVGQLLKFGLRGNRPDLTKLIILSLLIGLMSLAVPLLSRYLYESVIPGVRRFELWQILVGLVVVALAVVTFQLVRANAILRLETKVSANVQSATWDRLLNLGTPFFRQYSAGDLASRAMVISQIRALISQNVLQAALGFVAGLVSLALLFFLNVGLAWLVLGLVVITLLITFFINLYQLRHQRALTEKQGHLAGMILQMISGINKLRVAGAEIRAFARWAEHFSQQRKLAHKARSVSGWLIVFSAVWPILTLMSIFGGVALWQLNNLAPALFISFLTAYFQVLAATLLMGASLTQAVQVVPLYQRAKAIYETVPEVNRANLHPGELNGSIEINHVWFRYSADSPHVLKDLSLKIKPGQFVAIVGPSGAGKSSLLRLLLGFDTPESGSLYYNDQDLAGLDIQAVRRQIGTVIQNGKLIPGTIYTNIVGNGGFSEEEAWEAARLAGVDKDIQEMPMGMSTMLSESASTLSGGQQQRILIARAIVSRPRIILFDEATSALDNQTQATVSQSLENLQATRIVIAHRLSTIVNADCIYVLEGGQVAQSGTYQELLAQEGPFRELARRQLA